MPLPKKSNHMVTLAEASVLTSNFRRTSTDGIKGGLFWREAIQKLLDQPGCVAMRYYYGREDSGKPVLVLVGVDHVGKDMTEGVLLELSWPCPPFCADPNLLNSSINSGVWSQKAIQAVDSQEVANISGQNILS